MRMNNGIAIRTKLVLPSQARFPIMFHKLGLEILKNFMSMSAIAPSAPATYNPPIKNALIMPNAAPIAIIYAVSNQAESRRVNGTHESH